jgi:hypothetical protein
MATILSPAYLMVKTSSLPNFEDFCWSNAAPLSATVRAKIGGRA